MILFYICIIVAFVMLRIRLSIKFYPFLLLLLYLFSNSPSILFHHHQSIVEVHRNVARSVRYKDDTVNHKTRISQAREQCALCDNHTISVHYLLPTSMRWKINEFGSTYLIVFSRYCFQAFASFSTRGPPSVSF